VQRTPGGRDFDSIENDKPHYRQSLAESMDATGEELDNQQVVPDPEVHILAPERESSLATDECTVAASNPDADNEAVLECVMDKGKQKVEEKKKEPMFIRGVELVGLDDCDVLDRKLQCDSDDLDDDEDPNTNGIRVRDGPGSCSQTMEANDESTSMSMAPKVGEHFEPHTTTTVAVEDLLFNTVGKNPHPGVVIVKQEASWF
jgi:hypothetical protein